jgi:hypothetical protein
MSWLHKSPYILGYFLFLFILSLSFMTFHFNYWFSDKFHFSFYPSFIYFFPYISS